MIARDVMATNVLTVTPDTPIKRIADVLLEHAISAVPVVQGDTPVGMVSEGDLVMPRASRMAVRRNRLLRCLVGSIGGGEGCGPLSDPKLTAKDIMSAPVITSSDDSSVEEVLELMIENGIKRVPILRGGRLVGLVSRADLVRALARSLGGHQHAPAEPTALGGILAKLDAPFLKRRHAKHAETASVVSEPPQPALSAADFRASVEHYKENEALKRAEHKRQEEKRHAHDIEVVLGTHITDDDWRKLLLAARYAAESGQTEYQILTFPRETCSDGGRKINVGEEDWPTTLRGEAAELWLRYDRDLKARGFRVVARTVSYKDGIPNDLGLWLVWGEGR